MIEKTIFITSWLTQAFFVLAILSGIPLLFFYHTQKAYDSVQIITYLIPNGNFIRKFHYFSSEALLIFALIHTTQQLFRKQIRISHSSWNYAVAALIFTILLLFGGFVLKADLAGHSAGIIAIGMIHHLGAFSFLSRFIESSRHYFYWKFFLWHAILLPALLIAAVHLHIKRIDAPSEFVAIAAGITVISIFLLSFPADIAPYLNYTHIKGPWFFNGIEELLNISFPVYAILIQMIIPFLLLILYWRVKHKTVISALFFLWLIYYAAISSI